MHQIVASLIVILVNGAPQPQYAHNGRVYVEALKGREYAVRLHNPYPVRVAIALSVDGLNTIDARHTAAADARTWVLDPYETVTISGWQVSSTHARTFEFTTEEKSYGQALGKTANLGTISAVFFKERVAASSAKAEPYRGDTEPHRGDTEPHRGDTEAHRGDTEPRRRNEGAPPAASSMAGERASNAASRRSAAADEYAATGMGQRTDHAVTQVWLDLEPSAAQTINIRYEFREQLVRLGVLPRRHEDTKDPLARRERARGFEAGFAPEVR